jgi:hypothetical protein
LIVEIFKKIYKTAEIEEETDHKGPLGLNFYYVELYSLDKENLD